MLRGVYKISSIPVYHWKQSVKLYRKLEKVPLAEKSDLWTFSL